MMVRRISFRRQGNDPILAVLEQSSRTTSGSKFKVSGSRLKHQTSNFKPSEPKNKALHQEGHVFLALST
jgi:hypothetical protein